MLSTSTQAAHEASPMLSPAVADLNDTVSHRFPRVARVAFNLSGRDLHYEIQPVFVQLV